MTGGGGGFRPGSTSATVGLGSGTSVGGGAGVDDTSGGAAVGGGLVGAGAWVAVGGGGGGLLPPLLCGVHVGGTGGRRVGVTVTVGVAVGKIGTYKILPAVRLKLFPIQLTSWMV